MLTTSHQPASRTDRGFTLIEVMVGVLILSIGLLGVATMQLQGLQYSQGSYQLSQANAAVAGIIDRMRANPLAVSAGQYNGTIQAGSGALSNPGCIATANGCTTAQTAQHDLWYWGTRVLPRVGPVTQTSATIAGPAGGGVFTITVVWADQADSARTLAMRVQLP